MNTNASGNRVCSDLHAHALVLFGQRTCTKKACMHMHHKINISVKRSQGWGERLPVLWLRAAGPLCAVWNATVLINSYGLLRPTNVGARLCVCTFNKQVEQTYMWPLIQNYTCTSCTDTIRTYACARARPRALIRNAQK